MKLLVYIPRVIVGTYHHGGSMTFVQFCLWVPILGYLTYIAAVFMKRGFDDYENRNQFLLSLFIPFRDWVLFLIDCFKKP